MAALWVLLFVLFTFTTSSTLLAAHSAVTKYQVGVQWWGYGSDAATWKSQDLSA
jgi:hypothetical protein